MVVDCDDQCTKDNESEFDKDQGNQCLDVKMSSSVMIEVSVGVTLTLFAL